MIPKDQRELGYGPTLKDIKRQEEEEETKKKQGKKRKKLKKKMKNTQKTFLI